MEQKTIWMPFLIIGISLFLLLTMSGCDKDDVEDPIQHAEYVYINQFNQTLRFELYDSVSNASQEFDLAINDSIIFKVSGTPGAFPFTDNEVESRTGDAVVINFKDDKCTNYSRNRDSGIFDGDGVFDLSEYENYSKDLVDQNTYRLRYLIGEKDYLLAKDCE